jgi:hypothetical protein
VSIVMGLDQHRGQITGEWIGTDAGEVQRTRVVPADRAALGALLRTEPRGLRRLGQMHRRADPIIASATVTCSRAVAGSGWAHQRDRHPHTWQRPLLDAIGRRSFRARCSASSLSSAMSTSLTVAGGPDVVGCDFAAGRAEQVAHLSVTQLEFRASAHLEDGIYRLPGAGQDDDRWQALNAWAEQVRR